MTQLYETKEKISNIIIIIITLIVIKDSHELRIRVKFKLTIFIHFLENSVFGNPANDPPSLLA